MTKARKKMITVQVSSGGYHALVQCAGRYDFDTAFKAFLKAVKPKALGYIASISGPDLDDVYYVSPISMLKKLERFEE